MPRLACWSCGRQIYTVAPLESLFAEERRCPRCGAFLNDERREAERRTGIRRQNPPDDPGRRAADAERRVDERRHERRRPVDGPAARADGGAAAGPRPIRAETASSGAGRLHEPVAQREGDRLELRVDAELAHDVLDVRPERVRGDEQPLADLGRRQALGQRPQDLELARRQRLDRSGARRRARGPRPRAGRSRRSRTAAGASRRRGPPGRPGRRPRRRGPSSGSRRRRPGSTRGRSRRRRAPSASRPGPPASGP